MTRVDNYTQNYYNSTVQTRKDSSRADKTTKEEKAKNTEPAKLSRGAQKVLDELKKKYSNMDFMVADFESSDEAKDILSRGNKDFSVLFSTDELEKMAADEDYKEKNIGRIDDAVDFSNRINQQFGLGKADDSVEVKQVGVSFDSNGTMTYFAELEKSSEKQRERIEQSREKNAEEKKVAAKKTDYQKTTSDTKTVTVTAYSEKSLLEKMRGIDWAKVKEDEQEVSGRKFDYTI